jgi:hypothetical protein
VCVDCICTHVRAWAVRAINSGCLSVRGPTMPSLQSVLCVVFPTWAGRVVVLLPQIGLLALTVRVIAIVLSSRFACALFILYALLSSSGGRVRVHVCSLESIGI